jgi:hypothetical protein
LSEDRRQSLDRRDHRLGGRRETDLEPDHGTRARYRRGCPCTPCRAAEATYRADLRKDHAHGTLRLGMHISAKETWQRIRQLRPEFETQQALAARLGFRDRHLQLQRDVISVRNMLRVRLLHRQLIVGELSE